MKNRVNTYLAIALTTNCNFQCFYCKKGGESISTKKETIPYLKLEQIIKNAYDIGISNFRITGGEPTSVSYFSKLIEYIMKFNNTRIRINTNGYKILDNLEILIKYKSRIDIVFSVDSISEYLQGIHFQKFLSNETIRITKLLRKNQISVRYNIVVTSLNKCEIEKLILKSVDDLNVNVKLLDLNRFSEYLGYSTSVSGKSAFNLWEKLFVPMNTFYKFLQDISYTSEPIWSTGLISKNQGIPMSSYFRGENWIQVKDSSRGARYSEFCKKQCNFYSNGDCQEGVFSLFLSSNLMLHLSGCKNSSIHFNLNDCDDSKIKKALLELLSFI